MAREIWQQNYMGGRYNRWPYDAIVSAVMRCFGRTEDRGSVRILDLGCGGGNNTYFLAEMGFDFRAIDAAPEGVRLTRERAGLADDDARVSVGDFVNLPYEDQSFDAVIERASLCCNLSEDLRTALREIERVLKPGGVFIGVDMYGEKTSDLQFGTSLGDGDYNAFTGGIFVHSQEVHAFTPEQISNFFSNFDIESLERINSANLLADDHNRETYNLIARKLDTKT